MTDPSDTPLTPDPTPAIKARVFRSYCTDAAVDRLMKGRDPDKDKATIIECKFNLAQIGKMFLAFNWAMSLVPDQVLESSDQQMLNTWFELRDILSRHQEKTPEGGQNGKEKEGQAQA